MASNPASILKRKIVEGGAAILIGVVGTQCLRLLGNLILTRLLYPEAFGLMVIVNLVLTSLQMLSDVGIREAVITRTKDSDIIFLDTAWSLMVIRGIILAAIAMLLAYPVSLIYHEPELFWLIIVGSLGLIVSGLISPQSIVFERDLKITRVAIWKLSVQFLGLATTILCLYIHPTIWFLAAHGVFIATYSAITSYFVFKARRPRFRVDPDASRELIRFGRWVLIATALAFFAHQGDNLLLSTIISPHQLGIFAIGATLAKLTSMVSGTLGRSLLMPVYSRMKHEDASKQLRQVQQLKISIFLICLPLILLLSMLGVEIVSFLYDERYHGAGWITETLAIGSIFVVMTSVLQEMNLAYGESRRNMWRVLCQVVGLFCCMIAGNFVGGFQGIVIGIVVAQALDYAIVRIFVSKYKISNSNVDYIFLSATSLLLVAHWYLTDFPKFGIV